MFEENKNSFSCRKNNKDVNLIANKKIFNNIEQSAVDQLLSITQIDSVYKKVIGLPDMHVGFGVPIGCCFATDYDTGIISSEAVGFDINCGVRLIKTNLYKNDLSIEHLKKITKALENLPLGLSHDGLKITNADFEDLLLTGVDWAIKNNLGAKNSKKKIDDQGSYKDASIDFLSKQAKKRGLQQIGTLGQGNHFIDLLLVSDVFDEKQARALGLFKDQYCILLHTGSRGFGHQVATDFTNKFTNKTPISYEPFHSKLGQEYYQSMLAAANFAFVNRTVLNRAIEDTLKKTLADVNKDVSFDLLYDLCHNIAKVEKHSKKLIVHRKGATRVYTKDAEDNKSQYKEAGVPVILPGSMQHKTHVLLPGSKENLKETFNTVAHGSGRQMSRKKAKSQSTITELKENMQKDNIILSGRSENVMREETPLAYKPSEDVVDSLVNAKLVKKVVSLKPRIVITG